jgi:hypothetical protein
MSKQKVAGNITCCGVHPKIIKEWDDQHSWGFAYICLKCKSEGRFGMLKP